MISKEWQRRILVLLFLSVAFFIGSRAQAELGLSFSLDGLGDFRAWVQSLGWWGPLVFMLLIVVRIFIGLSSHLMLILGGLVFGISGGIVWGAIGVLLSSLVYFYLAYQLGAGWIENRFGDQHQAMLERIQRLGAVAIFAITAHPLGVLTPSHLAAGLVGLNIREFTIAVAVAVAAPIRAIPFAFLGTAVLDLTLMQSLAIAAVMLLVFIVPLFHLRVREWVWGN